MYFCVVKEVTLCEYITPYQEVFWYSSFFLVLLRLANLRLVKSAKFAVYLTFFSNSF